jgi:hypothetical protein
MAATKAKAKAKRRNDERTRRTRDKRAHQLAKPARPKQDATMPGCRDGKSEDELGDRRDDERSWMVDW